MDDALVPEIWQYFPPPVGRIRCLNLRDTFWDLKLDLQSFVAAGTRMLLFGSEEGHDDEAEVKDNIERRLPRWDVAIEISGMSGRVRPTDLVASHFCRAFLEAEKVSVWERRLGTRLGLHSEYGPHIDGKGILSFTTNVCATMAVRYIGETWFRFADAANTQQAVGMLAEEVWGEVSNDTAMASVAEIEEVEAEVQRTLEIARFLAGPVTQAVWPTMLLDPFFHLPNLRDEWDHLGSAHSLEVMSLTSMMQRSLLPNVLNNRARDMMLQLLARLRPTEELDAVLEFIDRSAIVNRVAVHFSMGHMRDCQTEMLDVTEKVMLCLLWTSTATAIQATAANVCSF
ncbi:hypothetical protein B0H14DRAFT_2634083 [Mycena olivaceomarginata]|nr:hypothetical protein B0H14DRAFT_2634083 [Mycena olivaceomarginata]